MNQQTILEAGNRVSITKVMLCSATIQHKTNHELNDTRHKTPKLKCKSGGKSDRRTMICSKYQEDHLSKSLLPQNNHCWCKLNKYPLLFQRMPGCYQSVQRIGRCTDVIMHQQKYEYDWSDYPCRPVYLQKSGLRDETTIRSLVCFWLLIRMWNGLDDNDANANIIQTSRRIGR